MSEEAPKGWVKSTVGEFISEVKDKVDPKEIPNTLYVGLEHIESNGGLIGKGDSSDVKSQKSVFKKGDILYGKLRPYLNKHIVAPSDGVCSTDILVYRGLDSEINSFFNYYLGLAQTVNLAHEESSGINLPRLSAKKLSAFSINVPPLPEQKRIVVKLDQLFAHLDELKTRLGLIPELFKSFRQAVLHEAVTGRLTEEWRKNKNRPKWKPIRLEDFALKIGSGSTPRGGASAYKEQGIPLVRSMNVHFGGIKMDGLVFIDEVQADKLKNVELKENDVLLNITGASIGRVCLCPKELEGGRVNQHVSIIRVKNPDVAKFIAFCLESPEKQDLINRENYGVTRQALTKQMLLDLRFKLPSNKELVEIIRLVENLLGKSEQIYSHYSQVRSQIDVLPQAILAKAFKGELVPQDPNDEPAEELLKRIEALQSKSKPKASMLKGASPVFTFAKKDPELKKSSWTIKVKPSRQSQSKKALPLTKTTVSKSTKAQTDKSSEKSKPSTRIDLNKLSGELQRAFNFRVFSADDISRVSRQSFEAVRRDLYELLDRQKFEKGDIKLTMRSVKGKVKFKFVRV